ncbi:hypothetical protein G7068_13665 [Leucobacter viscericola]|uniref:DUF7574 domain-containing protein n=1 Tax=Leucobacter viscericola TaxID=2714935 RepID=A0A6G7XI20_9MICO|nr:hypothetical protein [Leucobacter viscericola]QIK64126.1 hypothetical protein G7068_13665 [Leucobacter viscericola]
MKNIHDNPADFGMIKVDEFDLSDGCWQFDYVMVWQSITDKRVFYVGTDSGCSCPSPYEDVQSIEDLERLNPDNPRPQIETLFRLGEQNYTYSAAELQRGVSDMVARVKKAQEGPRK